jgi:opacity protein-like surface antigen
MRRYFCLTALIVVLTGQASAADFRRDMIGGPPPMPNRNFKPQGEFDWGGLYGGVQAGFSSADVEMKETAEKAANSTFRNSIFSPLIATTSNAIRGKMSDQKPQFGAYVGKNWVEGDLVIGLELDYVAFGDLKGQRSDEQARFEITQPGAPPDTPEIKNVTQVSASNRFVFKDAVIAKARFGQAFDRWLPYGFIGAGAVRADLRTETTVSVGLLTDDVGSLSPETVRIRRNRPVPALAAGLGLEYALADNIVARGEYMYLGLYGTNGTTGYVNSVRAGLAAKF